MKKINPLPYKKCRESLDPAKIHFATTDEVTDLPAFIEQKRVIEAINFGIGIKNQGYNMFVMGPIGLNKPSIIRAILSEYAVKQKPPPDWCYIHNFEYPEKPIAIKLPAGLGTVLQQDMKLLIEEIRISIMTVFESDEYRLALQKVIDDFNKKRRKLHKTLVEKGAKKHIPHLYRERHEQEAELQRRMTLNVVHPFIEKLRHKYIEYPKVVSFLNAVQNNVINNVNEFVRKDEVSGVIIFDLENPNLTNYQVNVIVNNQNRKGVPVVFERNPSYSNLICRVEYKPQNGTLVTDFTLIRPGALHHANGGFLIIEYNKIKQDPHAWESLKNALFAGKIKIEPLEDLTEMVRPVSLKPKSIPLKIKIVLLGSRNAYYHLAKRDPDFTELFKAVVDFNDTFDRNKSNIEKYSHLIAGIVKNKKLRPFDRSAVAAVIDHSTRLAEDVEKISSHLRRIDDLVQEADYWGGVAKKKIIDAADVKRAIEAQIYRLDRGRELYYEDILRNFVLINTKDTAIGQVNCLSVVKMGRFGYGHPTRLTAKVRMGKGSFLDIQREIRLAGPIHSKAGLTIANYLADRYSKEHLYSLNASISFEQMYGILDGDSASVGILCALLSAISNVPIKQNFAVTGSMNQNGEVQAIGFANEKVEGFFDICKGSGLTGKQGVILPAINVKNLMLREDVVEAVKAKKFWIYPIETVDQAIYLLTGMHPGEANKQGKFPKNSFNAKVQAKLEFFSEQRAKEKSGVFGKK